ncbi:MAG: hypothetical protein AB8G96_04675 [Phycisphaerales bacterium]
MQRLRSHAAPRLGFLATGAVLASSAIAQADTLDWLVIAPDAPWSNPLAWESSMIPGPDDVARFPSSGGGWLARIDIDAAVAGLLTLDPGGTVRVNSGRTLTILDDPADVNGILALAAGTFEVNGSVVVDDSVNGGGAIDNDGTLLTFGTASITTPVLVNDGLTRIEGQSGLNSTLALAGEIVNRGIFELESTGNGFAILLPESGTVTNEAGAEVLFSGGGSQKARFWQRDLENFGSIRVAAASDVRFNQAGTQLTLSGGDLTVEATGSLTNLSIPVTWEFLNTDFINDGTTLLTNGTCIFDAATMTGNPLHIRGGQVEFLPGADVDGTILLDGVLSVTGDVPAQTTLRLFGRAGLNTVGTFDGPMIDGTVIMGSDGSGFSQFTSATPATITGRFETVSGGSSASRRLLSSMDVQGELIVGAGTLTTFDQLGAQLSTTGHLEVEAGGTLRVNGDRALVIDGGTVAADGLLEWSNGSVTWNGGSISGTPWQLMGSDLTLAPGVAGPADFRLPGVTQLTGDIPADVTVRVEGRPGLNSQMSITGDVVVHGRLDLDSSGNGFALLDAVGAAPHTVHVADGGTLELGSGGSSLVRQIQTNLANDGTIAILGNADLQYGLAGRSFIQRNTLDIGPDAELIGGANTLRLEDGIVSNLGRLRWGTSPGRVEFAGGTLTGMPIQLPGTTLAFEPGVDAIGAALASGVGNVEGDLPPSFDLRIEGMPGMNTSYGFDPGATVDGTIEMVSSGNGFAEIRGPVGAEAPIVNRGSMDLLPGGSQPARLLSARLLNENEIRVHPGVTVQVSQDVENVGRLIIDAPFARNGASGVDLFNLEGGQLEGVGPIGSLTSRVFSAGVTSPGEASTAWMTIQGDWEQDMAGSLRIELGGDDAKSQQDRLVIGDEALLGGQLDIVLVDGFNPPIGSSFVVLEAADGLVGSFDFVNCPNAFTISQNATQVVVTIAAGAIQGDVNCDGLVNFTDLLSVLTAFGPCPGCPQDVDGDGEVGFADVLAVLAAWT